MGLFSKQKGLEVGEVIPPFQLQDQDGKWVKLPNTIQQKGAVIYFYPKDESGVCTKEACAFRDSFESFSDAGFEVFGVNNGSVESHKKFQQHHRLPFTLLSDPRNEVLKMFDIKNVLFLTGRETFVVDKKGKVLHKFRSFLNGEKHIQEALAVLK
ncbi:peroxiredoxin [Leeuwenhoekiella marinoflava]|uniref:thioredoxin-dependent peroxiredoxin n=2 Tax=Leeuwenhoekiella marinoflava TaxID=988 RepID=A0A4Q0PMV6_9FLAO|nr:peroxiredoxin [Leeuwenhoekiella marinoflava]RXG31840.1 peroxiredoxin Q/BCP [Leeuwenhoekiella marinoflava]SHF03138.1 peroxiredoxin Q/BCP [Leeuwenhoekiella marinoflava DSM 3653]